METGGRQIMRNRTGKVAIVGAGLVGSSAAYSMINQAIAGEIMLIGRTYEKAFGQALDLSHSMDFTYQRTKVHAGTYADCKDMDVIVLTAGANVKPGQTRLDILEEAEIITKDIVQPIMESGFNGVFVVAANPVDIITYLVWKLSGLPRNQVIGTGTSIDSSRLKTILSEVFSIDPRSVHGYALGEHGESQFVAWSHVTIGGKPILHILEQHKERFKTLDLEDIARKTRDAGWEIFTRKGSTQFGIGSAIAFITRSILTDDHKIIAVSAILDGEYGETDMCIGVPAIIGSDGIKELLELNLSSEEMVKFKHSCQVLRNNINNLTIDDIAMR